MFLLAIRYAPVVSAALARSIARNFESALRLMEAALTDCPDGSWETDLWPVDATTRRLPRGGLHGSATWFLGYHALTCLDNDRPDRSLLRTTGTASAQPARQPSAQPRDVSHRHHPDSQRHPRPRLLRTQESLRQEPQRSAPRTHPPHQRRGLPAAHRRRQETATTASRTSSKERPGRTPRERLCSPARLAHTLIRQLFGQVTARTSRERTYASADPSARGAKPMPPNNH
jgi:hypothetical protein